MNTGRTAAYSPSPGRFMHLPIFTEPPTGFTHVDTLPSGREIYVNDSSELLAVEAKQA